MCNFPDIEYSTNYPKLDNQKIPMGTYTYMKKHGLCVEHILDEINDIGELEERIKTMIEKYCDGDDESLYQIFCLIQIWGGYWGRLAIRHNLPFVENWNNNIKKQYHNLVRTCINIRTNENNYSDDDLKNVLGIIRTIIDDKNIHGLGVAFLTKHIRFWLEKNNSKNALPIFDSVMANGLFGCNASTDLLMYYWKCMIEKAKLIDGMQLCILERQLFNYFKTNPKTQKKVLNVSSSIPKYWRNDDIIEGEWIELNNIPALVFVGCDYKSRYYCELNLWENREDNIKSLKDAQKIFSEFKKYRWSSKKNQYKYVKFGTDDNSKNMAIELMREIVSFI